MVWWCGGMVVWCFGGFSLKRLSDVVDLSLSYNPGIDCQNNWSEMKSEYLNKILNDSLLLAAVQCTLATPALTHFSCGKTCAPPTSLLQPPPRPPHHSMARNPSHLTGASSNSSHPPHRKEADLARSPRYSGRHPAHLTVCRAAASPLFVAGSQHSHQHTHYKELNKGMHYHRMVKLFGTFCSPHYCT